MPCGLGTDAQRAYPESRKDAITSRPSLRYPISARTQAVLLMDAHHPFPEQLTVENAIVGDWLNA